MEHYIRAFGPISVCNYIKLLGFEPEPALEMAGLEPAEIYRPGSRVPAAAAYDLVEAASRVTGRSDFGLLWGKHTTFRRYGPLATYLMHCESIRQAVTLSEKFLARYNWGTRWRITDMGELARVEFQVLPKGRFPSHQYVESLMATQLSLWTEMLGDQWVPAEIWFHHQAQAPREIYESVFGCSVQFGMLANAVVARTTDFDRRATTPDLKIRAVVEAMLVEELRCADMCFANSVRDAIRTLIPEGHVDLQQMSRVMQLDSATLARRLEENGLSIRGVVTEVRLEVLAAHAERNDLTPSALLQKLGFKDLASLKRFVRQNMRRIRASAVMTLLHPSARH